MVKEAHNKILVWVIILSQFTPPFMFSAVAVALPPIGIDLGANAISLSLIETLFLAGQLIFFLPMGRFADATDRRTLFKVGLCGMGVFSLLIAVTSWVPLILFLRFCQGICSAMIAAGGPAILTELVEPKKRGRAFGALIGSIYAGLTAGPLCAGYIIAIADWRMVFIVGGILILVAFAVVMRLMSSKWKSPEHNPVNLPSLGFLALATLMFVAGSSFIHTGYPAYFCLVTAVMVTVVFVGLQKRIERPLVNVTALMNNKILSAALLIQTLLYMSAFSTVFMLNMYLQTNLAQTPEHAGEILAASSIIMIIMAPLAGILSDKFRPRYVSAYGVLCILVMSVMGVLIGSFPNIPYVFVMLFIQSLGFALFSSPNMTIIMNSVPPHFSSIASALAAKSRSVGMMSGMLMSSLLISLKLSDGDIHAHPAEFSQALVIQFFSLSVISLFALIICVKTRTRQN